jgi:hypothetical protein
VALSGQPEISGFGRALLAAGRELRAGKRTCFQIGRLGRIREVQVVRRGGAPGLSGYCVQLPQGAQVQRRCVGRLGAAAGALGLQVVRPSLRVEHGTGAIARCVSGSM